MGEKESFLRWLSHTQEIRQKGEEGGGGLLSGSVKLPLPSSCTPRTDGRFHVSARSCSSSTANTATLRPLTVRVMSSWLSLGRTIGRGSASKIIFFFWKKILFLSLAFSSPFDRIAKKKNQQQRNGRVSLGPQKV